MWNNARQMNLTANALHVLLVFVLLGAAGYWAIQRPEFRLREIQIDGDTSHINSPTVRASVVGHLKGNYFTVDLDAARTAFEQMPWVRHASVRRVWPNALAVTLEEFKPLGTFPTNPFRRKGWDAPTRPGTWGSSRSACAACERAPGGCSSRSRR